MVFHFSYLEGVPESGPGFDSDFVSFILNYHAVGNQLERFWGVFGIKQQIRIRFSSSRKLFKKKTNSMFHVFAVQSHAMRLYMCMW